MLVLLVLAPAAHSQADWEYGMMIDAGSGGSRLHIFRWPPREADPMRPLYAAVTKPEEVASFSVRPGISSFAHNVSGLGPSMESLLKQAEETLVDLREKWYLMPIYLKATAGARDLYQDQRDAIFAEIRSILFACSFRFDSQYWARTVSGEEEAVHAWLTVNAIKGTFRSDNTEDTWGALDMGGASTQIVFIPKDISIIQNYFPLHVSYLHIHLYSHSFLEFGYRDANMRLVRLLMERQKVNGGIEDPLHNPCMSPSVFFAQPFSETFARRHDEVRWVRGTGNFTGCMELARFLLHTDARCYVPALSRKFAGVPTQENGACAVDGIYEPDLHGRKFVAMGQYAKLAQALDIPLNVPVSLADMLPGLMSTCAKADSFTYIEELDDPDGELQTDLISQGVNDPMSLPISRCWKVVWMFQLLQKGLRFPLDTTQITFANKLDGQEAGWALGAMMHEVNYYPWRPQMGVTPFFSADLPVDVPRLPSRADVLFSRGGSAGIGASDGAPVRGYGATGVGPLLAAVCVGVGLGFQLQPWWAARFRDRSDSVYAPLLVV